MSTLDLLCKLQQAGKGEMDPLGVCCEDSSIPPAVRAEQSSPFSLWEVLRSKLLDAFCSSDPRAQPRSLICGCCTLEMS